MYIVTTLDNSFYQPELERLSAELTKLIPPLPVFCRYLKIPCFDLWEPKNDSDKKNKIRDTQLH